MRAISPSLLAKGLLSALPVAFLIPLLLPGVAEPAQMVAPMAAGKHEVRTTRGQADVVKVVQDGGQSEYAPGEIIVKFKAAAAETLGRQLSSRLKVDRPQDTGLASIDALNARHGAAALEPVFKALHKRIREGKTQEIINQQVNSRFASRAKRAPRGGHIPDLSRTYKITVRGGEPIEKVLSDYRQNPLVEYAEPNYRYVAQWVPNDPYYSSSGSWGQPYGDMWGLTRIGMECAWETALASGPQPVTVAVVDTGVDYNHEDLAGKVWTNPGEIPGNGIDDDGNGYVDDYYGYDFSSHGGNPIDDAGHGTHVAGTIGAATDNGIGISGIALSARIMAVKGLDAQGAGYVTDLAEGIYYAADNGADVMNFSWGGEGRSKTLSEAIQYAHAHGCVLVAAAGNSGSNVKYFTPASDKEVITVAATDHSDIPAMWSNWGRRIDVAAPGGDSDATAPDYLAMNILSLRAAGTDLYCSPSSPCNVFILNDAYYRARGTSMAAPHVSGLAALILSIHPEFSNEQVRQAIRVSSDDLGDAGFDEHYGWGRINACLALQAAPPSVAWIASPASRSLVQGVVEVVGTAAGPDFQSYRIEYAAEDAGAFFPLIESATPVSDGVLLSWDTDALPPGNYLVRLTVQGASGRGYEDSITIHLNESTVEPGWPFDLWNSLDALGTPTLADLDGDGNMEIISATIFSKRLFAFRYDGTLVDGWPVAINIDNSELNEYYSPPAAGDVDKDGKLEVFINTHQGVYGFDSAGHPLPGWPQQRKKDFGAPVVLADVNQDSYPEVICMAGSPYGTTQSALLYAWRRNGYLLAGFPVSVGVAYGTNLAVGDVDKTNTGLEIVVPVCDDRSASVNMYDCRGNRLFSCPVSGYVLGLNVSLGDVNHDGLLEIVFMTLLAGNKSSVGVIDSSGHLVSEWTVTDGRLECTDPALGNLDDDPDLEIVAAAESDRHGYAFYKMYAWNWDGSNVSGWPIDTPDLSYAPVLADVDGDGDTEVVTSLDIERGLGSAIYAFHRDGSLVAGWPIDFYIWPSASRMIVNFQRTAIADIDRDGRLELAAGLSQGLLCVAEIPNSWAPATLEWPGAFHDAQHRSNYSPDPVAPDQSVAAPGIDKVRSPTFEPGAAMVIIGQGFGDVQGSSLVHIGSRTYDSTSPRITLWSDTKIRVKLPKYSCGWFDLSRSRRTQTWVTVEGVDSNRKGITIKRPATCP